jgi:hypothetical protein
MHHPLYHTCKVIKFLGIKPLGVDHVKGTEMEVSLKRKTDM